MDINHSLFPTELLVKNVNGEVFTDSRLVAEHFNKKHKNVSRVIKNLNCSDKFRRLNFEPTSYIDNWNRKQQMYLLTRDGFSILAMGFTGSEAIKWKEAFLDAFNKMEAELRAYREKEADALHQLRPYLDPVVKGTVQGLSRDEIARMIDKTQGAVTYHRSVARRLGLLPEYKH